MAPHSSSGGSGFSVAGGSGVAMQNLQSKMYLSQERMLATFEPVHALLMAMAASINDLTNEMQATREENIQLKLLLEESRIKTEGLESRVVHLEEENMGQGSLAELKKEVNQKMRRIDAFAADIRSQGDKQHLMQGQLTKVEERLAKQEVALQQEEDAHKKTAKETARMGLSIDATIKDLSTLQSDLDHRIKLKLDTSEFLKLKTAFKTLHDEQTGRSGSIEKELTDLLTKLNQIAAVVKTKVGEKELFEKMGREETLEVMELLQNRVWDELGRQARILGTCRTDTSFILDILKGTGDTAAGSLKCLSCTKLVPLTTFGPQSDQGRKPTTITGDDGNQYITDKTQLLDTTDMREVQKFRPDRPAPIHNSSIPVNNNHNSNNNYSVRSPQLSSSSPANRPRSAGTTTAMVSPSSAVTHRMGPKGGGGAGGSSDAIISSSPPKKRGGMSMGEGESVMSSMETPATVTVGRMRPKVNSLFLTPPPQQ